MNEGYKVTIDHSRMFKRYGRFALISCGIGHALFIPLFFWLGADQLALINFLSVAIYAYCIAILPRSLSSGDYRSIGWLVYFELIGHAVVATYYLGVDSGFQFYAYAIVALPFLTIDYGLMVKILRVVFLIVACAGIELFLSHQEPQISVARHVLIVMGTINISAFLIGTSILTYLYVEATVIARERLSNLASLDPLTGLKNRRTFSSFLEQELVRAERYGHPVSLLLIDIDFFKQINDSFGHDAGDRLLTSFAMFLDRSIRSTDLLARYGGEEFVVVLPETELAQAMDFGKRLRGIIDDHRFEIDADRKTQVTASIGVAEFPSSADTREGIVKSADAALYAAKQAGRNTVKAAGDP
jgi:diguanylate cyclase (GGDEF)-like protein